MLLLLLCCRCVVVLFRVLFGVFCCFFVFFVFFFFFFFFFNDTATTEIYTLSLHDALPICLLALNGIAAGPWSLRRTGRPHGRPRRRPAVAFRSEEHTSELQSQSNLVC